MPGGLSADLGLEAGTMPLLGPLPAALALEKQDQGRRSGASEQGTGFRRRRCSAGASDGRLEPRAEISVGTAYFREEGDLIARVERFREETKAVALPIRGNGVTVHR